MHSATKRESADVIDLDSLAARCLGNVQLVERILNKFTAQLEVELETLEKALEARDAEAFRAIAHRLKGMSANVEAWPLHRCAQEAEERAGSDDLEELADQLERFQEIREQLATVLKLSR